MKTTGLHRAALTVWLRVRGQQGPYSFCSCVTLSKVLSLSIS